MYIQTKQPSAPFACVSLVSGLVAQLVWDAVYASLGWSFSCLRSCLRACCVCLPGIAFLLSRALSPILSPSRSGVLCSLERLQLCDFSLGEETLRAWHLVTCATSSLESKYCRMSPAALVSHGAKSSRVVEGCNKCCGTATCRIRVHSSGVLVCVKTMMSCGNVRGGMVLGAAPWSPLSFVGSTPRRTSWTRSRPNTASLFRQGSPAYTSISREPQGPHQPLGAACYFDYNAVER